MRFSGHAYIIPASYPLLSHESSDIPPPILLDGVHCDGTENLLTECNHRGIGIENCADREGEAGVICTSKIMLCI